ncbi:MAG TPA: hypothetical protein DDX19_06795 [Rhodopirellula baltica]|uniref:Uncharacterized protein n=1 Tax=Rhodopirellula baltica (strain DSM 10527 / NCIMB 13988 / SH1) TaxID=243090 RepID=Q7UW22_RHOBA|nr:hypothetical protein [Rhodopirellula baltica]CAD72549.1 hypothetical protein-signal peptide prediction [Rhodopirellula baltica SH 1]HBE62441.1 hypothetical protein [Rhodopirellula baltica]
MKSLLAFFLLLCPTVIVAEERPRDLKGIEAALKASPDDPMLRYGKCRALFADGKEQEAIDHASITMAKFIKAEKDLAWIGLGSIETKQHRIDVHFNMGPKERAERKDGIVRPYSFRVWEKGDNPDLVHVLDFELGYSNGKVATAAIGEMTSQGHGNYGIIDPQSDFAAVKKEVLEILSR